MALKWHAVCPVCARPVSRRGMLTETFTCTGCSARLQQNQRWNQVFISAAAGVGALIIAAIVVVRIAHLVSVAACVVAAIASLGCLLAASVWAWPYSTKYDLIEQHPAGSVPTPSDAGNQPGAPSN